MKLLLDTHAFIWWDSDPSRLSQTALTACKDPANNLILSVCAIWEIQIKFQLGKLQINTPLRELIDAQQANGIQILPITSAHVLSLEKLPNEHKDSFDRLLIAQAIEEQAVVMTNDPMFQKHSVQFLW